MKKNISIIVVLLAVTVGYFIGKLVLNQYGSTQVFAESANLYFFQYGVYSSEQSVSKNFNLSYDYISLLEDDKYHVYIAICKDEEVKNIIEDYFKENNINVYVKQKKIDNLTFLETLKQNDKMLLESKKDSEIKQIIKQNINKYKELVVNESAD